MPKVGYSYPMQLSIRLIQYASDGHGNITWKKGRCLQINNLSGILDIVPTMGIAYTIPLHPLLIPSQLPRPCHFWVFGFALDIDSRLNYSADQDIYLYSNPKEGRAQMLMLLSSSLVGWKEKKNLGSCQVWAKEGWKISNLFMHHRCHGDEWIQIHHPHHISH